MACDRRKRERFWELKVSRISGGICYLKQKSYLSRSEGRVSNFSKVFASFRAQNSGAVLIELMLAAPILLIFTAGLFELGNIFWQRQQLQIGVRDAARYLSRCNATICNYANAQATARNIALYSSPTTQTALRVPGWDDPASIEIAPAALVANPGPSDMITVSASTAYAGSPFFSLLGFTGVTLSYSYSMRYIGW